MILLNGPERAVRDVAQLFRRKGGGGHGSSSHGGEEGGEGGGTSGGSKGNPAKSHGASSEFTSSHGASSFGLSTKSKLTATAYSDGGGKQFTLGSDTSFSGRQAGGGSRSTVYGTSRFGSGYPYDAVGTFVDIRPFPYVFYPAPPAYHYYGGDEYLNVNSTERPGGNLVYAIVQPSWNTSGVTYRILGDNSSVSAVLDALVANCSVANSSDSIIAFTPTPSTWPLPEQIIQYYRASTFELSLDGYNNTAALLANVPVSNTSAPLPLSRDTPLPAGLNTTFLQCINTTVGASVPMMDNPSKSITAANIAKIILFSLQFILIGYGFYQYVRKKLRQRRERKEREERRTMYGYDSESEIEESQGWLSRVPFIRRFTNRVDKSKPDPLEEAKQESEVPQVTVEYVGTPKEENPAYDFFTSANFALNNVGTSTRTSTDTLVHVLPPSPPALAPPPHAPSVLAPTTPLPAPLPTIHSETED